MPVRTASFTRRISANGLELHRARERRIASGAKEPSEAEAALADERRQLKDEREKRKAQGLQPRRSAVDRMVRTHHAQPKAKQEVKAAAKDSAATKKPKAVRSRAEKHAEKDAAIAAARTSRSSGTAAKKPAK